MTTTLPQCKPRRAGKKRERFWELDFVRGVCVLLMVFDHTMQLMFLSGNPKLIKAMNTYMNSPLQHFGHISIRIVFFLVCGISCILSRSNGKRGMQLFGVACALTFFTLLLSLMESTGLDGMVLYFGVLHMLAVAILYYSVIATLSENIPHVGKYIPAAIGVFLLFLYYFYIKDKVGNSDYGFFPAIIGYQFDFDIMYADYAPLFPEMAYVLIGSGIGLFYKSRFRNVLKPLDGSWNKPLCFVGKHALIIYVFHPIVIGGLYMLFM